MLQCEIGKQMTGKYRKCFAVTMYLVIPQTVAPMCEVKSPPRLAFHSHYMASVRDL
jgi:hypothetical protein